jgi:hypothetical protein
LTAFFADTSAVILCGEARSLVVKKTQDYPQLTLHKGFGERDTFEIRQKGWFNASVKTKDGIRYTISFFDPVRLRQEMEDNARNGEPCLAEPNLIIVPEVTVETIQNSIRFLWEKGFFQYFAPEQRPES